jgi:hypothetical protein
MLPNTLKLLLSTPKGRLCRGRNFFSGSQTSCASPLRRRDIRYVGVQLNERLFPTLTSVNEV